MNVIRKPRKWLWLIILCYVVLSLVYLRATPPLEASDEYKHYPVVQYIQTQRKLPVLDPDDPGLWLQEGAQPPLYHALMALLTAWIDTSDLPDVHQVNPHAFVGNPNQVANKNLILHNPLRERFPGQGTILAVTIIRLGSIGLGVGTLLLTARLGTLLFSPSVGLLAMALTAFNPMFLFVSAAVNNDSLAILLGHWILLLLVKLWQEGPKPIPHWLLYARLGFVLGVGILTKLSLGGLLGLAGLLFLWQAIEHGDWRQLFIGGGLVVVAALAISGWWFLRNQQLYGDFTALNVFVAVQGTRDVPIGWAGWVEEFGTFFRSYWGLFGGVNVAAPNPYYWICNAALVIGMVGLIKAWRDKKEIARPGLWMLPSWIAILSVLLIRWNIISPAFQGRLIFPALGAVNLLWARGLFAWIGEKWRTKMAVGLAGAFLLAAAVLPWTSIRPAYAFPQPLTAVSGSATFGPFTFDAGGGRIQLVGMEMAADQHVLPGEGPVKLALYWKSVAPVDRDYVSSLHLLGRALHSDGQVDRYPASGMVPTSRWQAGQIYRDVYHVYVDETAVAPARLRVAVSLLDAEADQTLPIADPDGNIIELLFVGEPVRLGAAGPISHSPETMLTVPFAKGITLTGFDLEPETAVPGTEVNLTLYWEANGEPGKDYTVFVHLLDGSMAQVAGADGPPVNNDYPTSLWQAGDQVDDLHVMALPPDLSPGEYTIRVGLYDPVMGTRLVREDGDGDAAEFSIMVGE